jgi:hypothetical protein
MINLTLAFSFIIATGFSKDFTQAECPFIGNTEKHILHVKGCPNYMQMLEQNKGHDNRKCFKTYQEAIADSYRLARNCRKEVRERYIK